MTGLIRAWTLALALVFGLSGAAPVLAAPTFPALSGRVVDDAHVLPVDVQADLTAKLAALENTNGDQLIVVTLPSLQNYPIEDYGYQLGRAWGIGQKGKNNGVLFIIAPTEHKVRVEVGYGLEPVLTDALTSMIVQQLVLPKFKAGDIPGGVTAGTDALVQQLGLDPAKAQANAQAAAQEVGAQPVAAAGHARGIPLVLIFIGIFFVLSLLGRGGGGLWALPFLFMGGGGFGGGRDDEGGGGDSFGGGGGGSFGGGGSSGGW